MNTGSLRRRVVLITLSLLALVLVGVVTVVTLVYRSSLQSDLRHKLGSAADAFQQSWPSDSAKQLIAGFSLEGIAVDVQPDSLTQSDKQAGVRPPPIKPGTSIAPKGSLVVLDQVLPDGTRVTYTASSSQVDSAVTRLLLVEIIVGLTALGLATLLLRRSTAAALRPLTHVAQTATRIAAGDTSQRLNPNRTDTELGAMAVAFDRMVDALEAAAAQAQAAETSMRRFLADASHELRTPIAALQASSETLLREQPPRPHRDELEATLARDAARLGRLVNDLLGLARLEANESTRMQPADMAAVIRAATLEAARDLGEVDISLDLSERAHVRGDADGLTRLLRNLLENAVAAVRPNGHVWVTLCRLATEIEVRVVDDGPGIPDSERDRIFERFVRLGTTRTNGSGLGLAIARRIALQHGGDLTCDPIPSGAHFTLRLPATPET